MANMSYCRFQNTLSDMEDCREHAADEDLSPEESKARRQLVNVCEAFIDDVDIED